MGCGYNTFEGFFESDTEIKEKEFKRKFNYTALSLIEETPISKIIIIGEKLEIGHLRRYLETLRKYATENKFILNGSIKASTLDDGFDNIILVMKDNQPSIIGVQFTGELETPEMYEHIMQFVLDKRGTIKTITLPNKYYDKKRATAVEE